MFPQNPSGAKYKKAFPILSYYLTIILEKALYYKGLFIQVCSLLTSIPQSRRGSTRHEVRLAQGVFTIQRYPSQNRVLNTYRL